MRKPRYSDFEQLSYLNKHLAIKSYSVYDFLADFIADMVVLVFATSFSLVFQVCIVGGKRLDHF